MITFAKRLALCPSSAVSEMSKPRQAHYVRVRRHGKREQVIAQPSRLMIAGNSLQYKIL